MAATLYKAGADAGKRRFLDECREPGQNGRTMRVSPMMRRPMDLALAAMVVSAIGWLQPGSGVAQPSAIRSGQPTVIYWCPDRPADQQIAASPEQGCAPLVQSAPQQPGANRPLQKTFAPIRIEDIQSVSTQYLRRYNDFLDCCADDVAELGRIADLEAEANHILQAIQSSGIYNRGTVARQYTLGEIVRDVALARRDLQRLHARLERYGKGRETLEGLDPETAGSRGRDLETDREAISQDFKARRAPSSARTGVNIQDTDLPNWYGKSPTGDSSLHGTTGTAIEGQSDLPIRPGEAIRDTSLTDHTGASAGDTTLPNSTGFGIGRSENPGGSSSTPTRVGPDVGDSTLNR